MGTCDQENSEKILDFFYGQGGWTLPARRCDLPTANMFRKFHRHCEQLSMPRIGTMGRKVDEEARKSRSNGLAIFARVLISSKADNSQVIATKYTTNFTAGGPNEPHIMANHVGNSTKSLTSSIASSLRNLQTDYIDVVGSPAVDIRDFI